MDEESGSPDGAGTDPGENHIVDCPNRWAGFGSMLGCLVSCVACSLTPDRIGVGAGHTFNRGSHLSTTAMESSGSSLRNNDNADNQSVFVYAEYDLKPQRVMVMPMDYAKMQGLYGPPRPIEITVTKAAEQEPVKTEPLPPNDDPVKGQIDNARQALELIESSSWDTYWKAAGYTALGLCGVGGWWFVRRRRKKKK